MNIVQIGCNNGDDHVFKYVQDKEINKILLIDPHEESLNKCKEKYSYLGDKAEFKCCAVVPMLGCNKVQLTISNENTEFCSLNSEHVAKHMHNDNNLIRDVDAIEINELLDHFIDSLPENSKVIDHLFIDAEGLDAQLLFALQLVGSPKEIKSERVKNIGRITFEHLHTDGVVTSGEKLRTILLHLENQGYSPTGEQIADEYSMTLGMSIAYYKQSIDVRVRRAS